MNKSIIYIFAITFSILAVGCGSDAIPIPKPPTYLRLDLPSHEYKLFKNEDCNYSFEISKLYKVNPVTDKGVVTCHKSIDLGALNGVIHFSYINMTEPLSTYVNYSIDKVEEHQIKASSIEDARIQRNDERVFGTLFELQGDVASPFQFYLTDSTSRFVSGVVYFNSVPNYDSLKPSLDYLKTDLMHMVNTFKWN